MWIAYVQSEQTAKHLPTDPPFNIIRLPILLENITSVPAEAVLLKLLKFLFEQLQAIRRREALPIYGEIDADKAQCGYGTPRQNWEGCKGE